MGEEAQISKPARTMKETLENKENDMPTVVDAAVKKEEAPMEKEVLNQYEGDVMQEKLESKDKARLEKEEQIREERLALACAKAAEREAQAAKRKEDLLAAKKEKARKQQE